MLWGPSGFCSGPSTLFFFCRSNNKQLFFPFIPDDVFFSFSWTTSGLLMNELLNFRPTWLAGQSEAHISHLLLIFDLVLLPLTCSLGYQLEPPWDSSKMLVVVFSLVEMTMASSFYEVTRWKSWVLQSCIFSLQIRLGFWWKLMKMNWQHLFLLFYLKSLLTLKMSCFHQWLNFDSDTQRRFKDTVLLHDYN